MAPELSSAGVKEQLGAAATEIGASFLLGGNPLPTVLAFIPESLATKRILQGSKYRAALIYGITDFTLAKNVLSQELLYC